MNGNVPEFTMDDFMRQMDAIQRLGTMQEILRMIPGMGILNVPENNFMTDMHRIRGMIHAMTAAERSDGSLMNPSRLERIAKGSGTTASDVSKLIADFYSMRIMIRKMAIMKMQQRID